MHMCGGFSHEYLPKPWDIVCYTIMHYIMVEDHFQVLYYYNLLILNHFRNLILIYFQHLVLHYFEDSVFNVQKKRE